MVKDHDRLAVQREWNEQCVEAKGSTKGKVVCSWDGPKRDGDIYGTDGKPQI